MNTICFGQQPCGFFPKRFLVAKINTARTLQKKIGPDASAGTGGKIVFFYHDSDADYRETITAMKDRRTGAEVRLNFLQPNKIQKKFSPLYAKSIAPGWKQEILKQLPRFVDQPLIDLFSSVNAETAADFCLKMYGRLGLLAGIEVLKSGDRNFREKALDLQEYFADVEYQGEIVRAQLIDGKLQLHEGGGKYMVLPDQKIEKWQKSPARDERFKWMQSMINCTHYIYGESEKEYLKFDEFPEVKFIERDEIDNPNYAWLDFTKY